MIGDTRFTISIKDNKFKSENTSVVLLASIMRPRTKTIGPTSLIRLNSQQTLLDYQVQSIKQIYPKSEIILVVGFEAAKVCHNKPNNVKIIENPFFESKGNAEEIRLALNIINNDTVIIIDGATVFSPEVLIPLKKHGSSILVSNTKSVEDVGTPNPIGKLNMLSYGNDYTWSNIGIFQEKELQLMTKFVANRSKNKYGYHEVVNYIADNSGKINVVEIKNGYLSKIENFKNENII